MYLKFKEDLQGFQKSSETEKTHIDMSFEQALNWDISSIYWQVIWYLLSCA